MYESVSSLPGLHSRVTYLQDPSHHESPSLLAAQQQQQQPSRNLVLFDDALRHLARICRVLAVPRASAMLVGVGGSGKQSLTHLAATLVGATVFTLSSTKTFSLPTVHDDVRVVFRALGRRLPCAILLVTDNDIKDDGLLEVVSQLLFTGNIQGLLSKDEVRRCALWVLALA